MFPKIVDWYMDKKINIDDLITHTMPLGQINEAFESDASRRIDSQRGYLLKALLIDTAMAIRRAM